MKKALRILMIPAVAAALVSACKAEKKEPGISRSEREDNIALKAKADSAYYMVGVQLGAFIKGNNFASGMDEIDFERIRKGLSDYMAAGSDSASFNASFEISPEQFQKVCADYIALRCGLEIERTKREGADFLAAVEGREGVTKTESGLLYEMIEKGDSTSFPTAEDAVWVRFTGTLTDGTEFDSVSAGSDSIRFEMTEVIKGWQEGLQLIGEGGHIKLYIPSALGYGDDMAQTTVKAGSTLVYDIELTRTEKKENNKSTK